ncbi:redoxin domain-containing protein [Jiangella aurantiaca]|uniref:Redoxin domain-containing protein n=1 Tax=Jiangella aurantiaca TaxID=2530373 RepID=A0A4R5AID2_9ACTN|nr:redoxin domain-containing protein [Jiangella aurantiaca]TDD69872.1 redoxin domain-containing protein [Jiangella aurantiaca]
MRPSTRLGPIAAALLLAACGSADDGGTEAAPAPSSTAATPSPTPSSTATTEPPPASTTPSPEVAVPEELAFVAPTVDGGTFDGASLAGQPAVLWFWAPWCPVCQREAPLIADLAAQYEGQVAFVGVAGLSGDLTAMEAFIADGGVEGITHIDDRDGAVYSRFGVTQQYDIGFVSADGTVEVIRGPLEEDEIVAEVERLVTG